MATTFTLGGGSECKYCCLSGGEMFRPCRCLDQVHYRCLDEWRLSGKNERGFFECGDCHASYILQPVDYNEEQRMALHSSINKKIRTDYAILMVLNFLFIFLVSGFAQWVDVNETFKNYKILNFLGNNPYGLFAIWMWLIGVALVTLSLLATKHRKMVKDAIRHILGDYPTWGDWVCFGLIILVGGVFLLYYASYALVKKHYALKKASLLAQREFSFYKVLEYII